MNRHPAGPPDDDDDDDEDRGWYDASHGYDSDEEEDEAYEEFVEREFGSDRRTTRLRPLYFWAAILVLISFCLPLLLALFFAVSS